MEDEHVEEPSWWLLPAEVAVVLVVLVAAVYMIVGYVDNHQEFDSVAWINADRTDYVPRNGMLHDLLEKHHFIGMDRKNVEELLGRPWAEGSGDLTYAVEIHYDIIDPDYHKFLVFKLDHSGVVTGYQLEEWDKSKSKRITKLS